jgi:anhydro-N-acetylmuramic acid kinase
MSGTSLDGVDAVLAEFDAHACRLRHGVFVPFPADLRRELLALNHPGDNELERAALAANRLAHLYADAIAALLAESGVGASAVRAIGSHGQTVRHRPDLGYTLQLDNPALLAELCGIAVAADFRRRDLAAGGQGAPLVPAFHAALFGHPAICRAIVNIGGIANVTWLAKESGTRGEGENVIGFDCGPGNLLLDAWCERHTGRAYDADGAWAAGGQVLPELLAALLAHPFFAAPPPKSTGRDDFHPAWLERHVKPEHAPRDVQATLLELSARGIADALQRFCPGVEEIYLCGGGAHNGALAARLAALTGLTPLPTERLGLPADWVEASAFAWLAKRLLEHKTGNLPSVTGARHACILGALYPA